MDLSITVYNPVSSVYCNVSDCYLREGNHKLGMAAVSGQDNVCDSENFHSSGPLHLKVVDW